MYRRACQRKRHYGNHAFFYIIVSDHHCANLKPIGKAQSHETIILILRLEIPERVAFGHTELVAVVVTVHALHLEIPKAPAEVPLPLQPPHEVTPHPAEV